MEQIKGTVIASHGRHYMVRTEQDLLNCVTRGKKSDVATGDHVIIKRTSNDQGVIEKITDRATLLYRSDQYRAKLLAANITQLMIVVAPEPSFSDDLVSRALVAAEAEGIRIHLLLNKCDLTEALPKARERLALYQRIGYSVIEISVHTKPDETRTALQPLLHQQSTLLIGQSGMGKSSLINILVDDADAKTREISAALDTGKHTTTFTRMYDLDDQSTLIDSPGFQEFGLYQLSEGKLERAFPEFSAFLGQCKFYNCHHLNEPGCAILQAVQSGEIATMRHALYAQLVHESSQKLY